MHQHGGIYRIGDKVTMKKDFDGMKEGETYIIREHVGQDMYRVALASKPECIVDIIFHEGDILGKART